MEAELVLAAGSGEPAQSGRGHVHGVTVTWCHARSREVTRGPAAVLHAHGATVPPTLTRGVAGARCACERGVTGGGVAASSSRRPEKVVTSGSSPSAGSGLLVSWSPSEGALASWAALSLHCHTSILHNRHSSIFR